MMLQEFACDSYLAHLSHWPVSLNSKSTPYLVFSVGKVVLHAIFHSTKLLKGLALQ